jgi:cytidine deaminase
MLEPRSLNLCLFAPSGSGKSTVCTYIREHLAQRGIASEVVKLADPLYRLQAEIYRTAGTEIGRRQDQKLLETLASVMRGINRRSIVEDFLRRYRGISAPVVLNDDLRDPDVDYPELRRLGFRFVQIKALDSVRGERLAARGDVRIILHSRLDGPLQRIEPDYCIDNSGISLEALRAQVASFVDAHLPAPTNTQAVGAR